MSTSSDTLPVAGFACNGYKLAGINRKIDIVQYLYGNRVVEILADMFCLKYSMRHIQFTFCSLSHDYSQRKVVLNERLIQVPESEEFKPSNPFKPLKPDYNERFAIYP